MVWKAYRKTCLILLSLWECCRASSDRGWAPMAHRVILHIWEELPVKYKLLCQILTYWSCCGQTSLQMHIENGFLLCVCLFSYYQPFLTFTRTFLLDALMEQGYLWMFLSSVHRSWGQGDCHNEENLHVAGIHAWSELRDVPWLCDYEAIAIT